jgi:hypothetical protein
MLVIAGVAGGWALDLRRKGDPAWRPALAAGLMSLSAALMANRLQAIIFAAACQVIAIYLLLSFAGQLRSESSR